MAVSILICPGYEYITSCCRRVIHMGLNHHHRIKVYTGILPNQVIMLYACNTPHRIHVVTIQTVLYMFVLHNIFFYTMRSISFPSASGIHLRPICIKNKIVIVYISKINSIIRDAGCLRQVTYMIYCKPCGIHLSRVCDYTG